MRKSIPLVLVELFMSLFWLTCRGSRPDSRLQRVGEQYLKTSAWSTALCHNITPTLYAPEKITLSLQITLTLGLGCCVAGERRAHSGGRG
eukprot:SAG31_NODE_2820_length_5041_cov_2.048968_2_plen_90_part_00